MKKLVMLTALLALSFTTNAEARRHRHGHRVYGTYDRHSVSLAGVTPALAQKAQQIREACGSTIISGVRHTRVRGTGHWSLHASGRAVDMRGNPACIYAHLQGWPGGYSVDYGRVHHVHISYGGREDGLRFNHGGHRHYGKRHRHKHHWKRHRRYHRR